MGCEVEVEEVSRPKTAFSRRLRFCSGVSVQMLDISSPADLAVLVRGPEAKRRDFSFVGSGAWYPLDVGGASIQSSRCGLADSVVAREALAAWAAVWRARWEEEVGRAGP